jgi:HEAT repeat protein
MIGYADADDQGRKAMRTMTNTTLWATLIVATLCTSVAHAGRGKAPVAAPLTPAGQKLFERYAAMHRDLRSQLLKAVPLNAQRKQALVLLRAEQRAQERARVPGLEVSDVDLKGGDKPAGVDDLFEELEEQSKPPKPKLDPKIEAVLKFQRVLAAEAKPEPHSPRSRAFRKVMDQRQEQAGPLLAKVDSLLSSDKLDHQLAKFVVLNDATPRGLAAFAQQSKQHEQLIEQLLADDDLMLRMVLNDGAKNGRYGPAMKIYTDILNASPKAAEGLLNRLALGTSLEHATPIGQRNPAVQSNAPKHVDPVKRYLHFEKAYLDGELDPGFKTLSAWDYRMVVNGYEPDWALAWGRQMLRNYRPDHISTSNQRWRYVASVRTDVRYGSQDNKYDRPELQFFQNILMNGGVCGRRAFFGRFILRAFGVPTIARPQKGHASLARWTPDGWSICLGGGWGGGWAWGSYNPDMNFLAVTQARMADESYLPVKRATWLGDVMGEKKVRGLIGRAPGFWYGVAYYRQRAMIEKAKAVALAAVGEDIAEANESKVKEKIVRATVTDADRKIAVSKDGVITIPAVACSKPTNSTRKIKFIPSSLGGMQLHYSRLGKSEVFEYTFDAPAGGRYVLTARIVTPSWKQHLFLTVNDAKEQIDIPLPHTVGYWDTTDPVEITLAKGTNILRFSRDHGRLKGVTIKDFTLTPIASRANTTNYANGTALLEPILVSLLDPPVRKALEHRFAKATSREAQVAACRDLIRQYPQDSVLQKLCFKHLVSLVGTGASDDLLTGLGSPNPWVRRFAREVAADVPGQDATQTWLTFLASAKDEVRPEVLRVLAGRRDIKAAPAIKTFIHHKHEPTKTAALSALIALGDPDGVSAVVKATTDPSAKVRKSAYLILASAPGAAATNALLDLARKAKTIEKNAVALEHGFLRVANGHVSESDKVAVLKQLIALTRRADEKRLVLPELQKLRAADGLRLAQSLLTDAALIEGAASIAVEIAEAFEEPSEELIVVAVDVLRDVIKHTAEPRTRVAAETFVYRHRPPGLDVGNPAKDIDLDTIDTNF